MQAAFLLYTAVLWIRIRDPGWKNRIRDLGWKKVGSGMEKSDPGSGVEKKKSDPVSGINIPDPQHCTVMKLHFC
jgi:hypothetical protein